MKTNRSVTTLSLGLINLALCAGYDQQSARAQDVPAKTDGQPPVVAAADEPKPADAKPAEGKPAEPATTPPGTPAAPADIDTNPVQNPVTPDQLKLTPALTDVIKLVQAGVGEEVLMTYITNSVDIFSIGPNEILYLHDLGVPSPIITALIHQDSTPEMTARKQAANAVQPLPPGVALNRPATNIFTPRLTPLPPAAPAPVTAEVTADDIPPADTNIVPTVIYTVPPEVQQPVNVSYFYTELAPYGAWIDVAGYGRCWRPTVSVWNSAWRPYCHGGRWLWTDCGWYWYSDYTWGAHTFHYGRWACPPGRGWVWVPDTSWGPSWVSWRHTGTHCAWAPLPPAARCISGRWYHNTLAVGADCEFGLSKSAYVALPKNQMLSRRPSNHFLTARHAETVVTESSVANHYGTVNNTMVNRGAGFDVVAKAAGGNIRPISIRSADTVGPKNPRRELLDADGKTLTVARPEVAGPFIKPPARPMSSLSGQRTLSGRQTAAITGTQTPTGTGTANDIAPRGTPGEAGGPTIVPSRTTRAPIIMRGSGRAAGGSTASVEQQANTPPATTESVNRSTVNNAGATPRAALPGGRRPSPEVAERSRSTAPSVVVTKPAPAVVGGAGPQPVRTPSGRPEPARVVVTQPRVQPAATPAPIQPRVTAASPGPGPTVYRVAPSAPAAATVSPRVESYRAASPAPAARAPAQSSGGSRPSYSRDSGGGSRGSR